MQLQPMLVPWGSLGPQVLDLIKIKPHLAERLFSAPPRAFHAFAAFLRLTDPGVPDAALARLLSDADPYELVGRVFPEADGAFLTILGRLEPKAWDAATYRRLEKLLRGPTGARAFLLAASFITSATIDRLAAMEDVSDPLSLHVLDLLGFDEQHADAVGAIMGVLRTLNMLEPDEDVIRILRRSGSHGIQRFLWKRLSRVEVPAMAQVPAGTTPIRSLRELRQASKDFPGAFERLPQILVDFLSGRAVFLRWSGSEPAIIYAEMALPGHCYLRDVIGRGNRPVGVATSRDVELAFARSGLRCSRLRLLTCFGTVLRFPFPEGEEWEDDYPF